jgi:hypothetical protein
MALVGLGTALVVGGLGAVGAAGCGGSDNGGGGSMADSSTDTSMMMAETGVDSGVQDAHADADAAKPSPGDGAMPEAGPMPNWPKIYVVNASPDAPPLRLCVGAAGSVLSLPPLPDMPTPGLPFPGLFPGTGGPLVAPADISPLTLTLYAVNALKVAKDTADGGPDGGAEITCDQLVPVGDAGGGNYLTPNVDFWQLGTIKGGTVADNNSYVVAITGCIPGEATDAGVGLTCGSGYSPTAGNLALTFFTLDSTTAIDAGSMGAQFANASTPWDYYASIQSPPAFTGAIFAQPNPADGGINLLTPILAGPAGFGTLMPMALRPYSGLTFDGTTALAAAVARSFSDIVYEAPMPFPVIEQLTYGAAGAPDGGALQNGKGFVFVLVGDPQLPFFTNPQDGGPLAADAGGQFNLHAPHILAFPTSNP